MKVPAAYQWTALAIYFLSHLVGLAAAIEGDRWGLPSAALPLVVLGLAVSGTLLALAIVTAGAIRSRRA